MVSVAYIRSISDRAAAVFREAMAFLTSHDRGTVASDRSLGTSPDDNSFLLAQRQRAGVSPVMRLKTVEKCACVQKPTASAISASGISLSDSSDLACSMR